MSFTGGILVIFLMLLLGICVLPSLALRDGGVCGWMGARGDAESTWEAFQSQVAQGKKGKQAQMDALEGVSSPLMEYPPGKPCPVALYSSEPYHLLSDVLPPVSQGDESLSCVTSRSCFAADMEAQMAKTGNYRQWTNQYKRGYPDHCSAPRQELVLSMYQASPLVLSRA